MAVINRSNLSISELRKNLRPGTALPDKRQVLLFLLLIILSLGVFSTLMIPKLGPLLKLGDQFILNIEPRTCFPAKRILDDAFEKGKKKIRREIPASPEYQN